MKEPYIYLLVVGGIIALPLLAQLYINFTYKKYLKVESKSNLSGFETARKILDSNNLNDIHIVTTSGTLTDHYDPSREVIRLSNDIFDKNTISSISVAAHECGHALQKKDGYLPMKIRTLLVPIVNFSSKIAYVILVIGFLLEFTGLIRIAIIFMSAGVLFQLVTLPVEINASRRAKKELVRLKLIHKDEEDKVKNVLTAAALTYVAGLLSSLLELLRLVLIINNRRD